MENKIRVLFICQHNSGRSQIAEAYLRRFGGGRFHVESAGLEPAASVNPLVVRVMAEEGIDLAGKTPHSAFQRFKDGQLFDHVITVCGPDDAQCPVFPGITRRWHRPFPDPAAAAGSEEEQLAQVRRIRDQIKDWLLDPPEGDFSFRTLLD